MYFAPSQTDRLPLSIRVIMQFLITIIRQRNRLLGGFILQSHYFTSEENIARDSYVDK